MIAGPKKKGGGCLKNLIFLVFSFFVLSGCEELPFTNEDIQSEAPKPEATKEEVVEEANDTIQTEDEISPLQNQKEISITIEERETTAPDKGEIENVNPPIVEEIAESFARGEVKVSITDSSLEDDEEVVEDGLTETKEKVTEWKISRRETERQILENEIPESGDPPEEVKPPLSEDEITVISGVFELEKNTVIQNRKVVLSMVTVKTFEYNLTIRAEEFVSNYSVIQNFPEGQKAEKKGWSGRDGGDILIETEIAQGSLQLILNGEDAGRENGWRKISKRKRENLRGRPGRDGRDAIYRTFCQDIYIPIILVTIDKNCWDECFAPPTRGEAGGDGRRGLPGFKGQRGGDSGSFHLKAYELSEFHLTSIQKSPGSGSKGSRGSYGGLAGKKGRNGKDRKMLCNVDLPYPARGERGKRGRRGKHGRNGREGKVCLEKLYEDSNNSWESRKKENTICY